MWIIPKNLPVSACVRDTLESKWESDELSQICEQSLLVRSKCMRSPTFVRRWKQGHWSRFLFGRTLKPSMDSRFVERWTSSWVATRARVFRSPEKDSGPKTLDTFGRILHESSRQLDLFTASSRTSPDTLASDSPKFIAAYETWVTRLRQACLQRQKSALPTEGNGCLSWPTSRSSDYKDSQRKDLSKASLTEATRMWPTANVPNRGCELDKSHRPGSGGIDLQSAVKAWPTPTEQDSANNAGPSQFDRNSQPLNVMATWPTPHGFMGQQENGKYGGGGEFAKAVKNAGQPAPASPSTNGKSRELLWGQEQVERNQWPTPRKGDEQGQSINATKARMQGNAQVNDVMLSSLVQVSRKGKLNPAWVCQLMGLRVGWTDLGSWETASSPSKPKKHSES